MKNLIKENGSLTNLSNVGNTLTELMDIMQRNEEICSDICILIGIGLPIQNKNTSTENTGMIDYLHNTALKAIEKQTMLMEMLASVKQKVS